MYLFESIWQDIRYAFRMMRSSLGLTTVAILSLALGIGATTAIFCVMNALILKPLPVREPGQLVEVRRSDGPDVHTYETWREIRNQQDTFSGVFAYSNQGTKFHLADGEEDHLVSGLYVSGDYFNTLGVPAVLGRTLVESDDQRGTAPVCVISYGLWQRQYGRSPNVIGRTILLNRHVVEVVGVAPRSFFGVDIGDTFEVIVPIETERIFDGKPALDDPEAWWLIVDGRLRPGVSISQASARLRILGPAIYKASHRSLTLLAGPIRPYTRYLYGEIVSLMMIMVGVVLIIACMNLANLLLARCTKRQREIATRIALGASRSRLIRQLITESIAVSFMGAAVGLVVARWGSKMLVTAISIPHYPTFLDLSWDTRLVVFTTATTLLCALLFGLAPALRATHVPLYTAMKSGPTLRKGRHRFSGSLLIVTQVSLSLALLVSAGLLTRTLQALLARDPGYDPKGILLVEADSVGRDDNPQHQAFVGDELLTEFRSVPGVISVARLTLPSARTRTLMPNVIIQTPEGLESRHFSFIFFISSDFFKTRRAPLVAGRDFTAEDSKTSPGVALLSERAANMFFPGVNPLGLTYRQVNWESNMQENVEIIGIAKDINNRGPSYGPLPIVYRPIPQCVDTCSLGRYELRFAGLLPGIRESVKKSAANIDSHLALNLSLLSDDASEATQRNRITAIIASIFGLLTVVLAVIGIYGVTSYATSQRTQEIGIRMALGAQPGNVFRMIVGEAITVVFAGVALGVALGFYAAQTIRGMLFGVTPTDPLTFIFAAGLMLSVAAIAAFLPAYRASKADPIVALRFE